MMQSICVVAKRSPKAFVVAATLDVQVKVVARSWLSHAQASLEEYY